jgi:hypothetical protein
MSYLDQIRWIIAGILTHLYLFTFFYQIQQFNVFTTLSNSILLIILPKQMPFNLRPKSLQVATILHYTLRSKNLTF